VLFPQPRFQAYLNELRLGRSFIRGKLDGLRLLLRRYRDGTLDHLSEQRIEQSFNERLFSELFDYDGLFKAGMGVFHLLPKKWRTEPGRYDDLSLGFFHGAREDFGRARVSVELKSPGTNLDAPQTDRRSPWSPVEQAFAAVEGDEDVRWIIVSDFDEIRLYDRHDRSKYESIRITSLLTLDDMKRAYALLGRPCLLGVEDCDHSPLDEFLEHGQAKMLQPLAQHIRLTQTAIPVGEDRYARFRADIIDKVERAARDLPEPLRDEIGLGSFELERDRIVWTRRRDDGFTNQVEVTTQCVIRSSCHMGLEWQYLNGHHQPALGVLAPQALLNAMSAFAMFSSKVIFSLLGDLKLDIDYLIEDAGEDVHWASSNGVAWDNFRGMKFSGQKNRAISVLIEDETTESLGHLDKGLAQKLWSVVREVALHFEHEWAAPPGGSSRREACRLPFQPLHEWFNGDWSKTE